MQRDPSPPIAIYGQWAVYPNGICCDEAAYSLTLSDLYRSDMNWVGHLSDKRWCNIAEFIQARSHLFALHRTRQEAA
jgi:hypothetical protein